MEDDSDTWIFVENQENLGPAAAREGGLISDAPVVLSVRNGRNTTAQQPAPLMPQEVTIEDALEYIDRVRFSFTRQPDKFKEFLRLLKLFKNPHAFRPHARKLILSHMLVLFEGHESLSHGIMIFLNDADRIAYSRQLSQRQRARDGLVLAPLKRKRRFEA
jgi:histone deacetylase complex regulatory component SIN3